MSKTQCVLHISDSHLYSNGDTEQNGLKPLQSLKNVLHAAMLEYKPDAVIHTGDTANEPIEPTYQNFLDTVRNETDVPLICTPGNHDLTKPFDAICPKDDLVLDEWYITTIDSHADEKLSGRVTEENLDTLRSKLDRQSRFTVVGTHHPPLPIGVSWLDAHRITNGDQLIDLCTTHNQVKSVICGHVHQAHESEYETLKIFTTPSTCWQFGEDSEKFSFSNKKSGWRWLFLHPTGDITTKVGRLAD